MVRTKKLRNARRARDLRNHREWARRQWVDAFDEDWDYEYLLFMLKAKLTTMAKYFRNRTYIRSGTYYGKQMELAVRLIDIILSEGGEVDYARIGIGFKFPYKVNMRNRARIPSPNYHGMSFICKEQRLRFDKAWMLLWRLLSEKTLSWSD